MIKTKGFTLIEIVVTLVIFTILSTITFSSYPQLNVAIGLNTSSRDLQSAIKTAQVTGVSKGGDYSGEGIYLDLDGPLVYKSFSDYNDLATPDQLGIYKGDKVYVEADDGMGRNNSILNGVRLYDVCVKNSVDASKTCSQDIEGSNRLSITYNRPSTRAVITNYKIGTDLKFKFFDTAYIDLIKAGPNPLHKCIIVYKFGQIELKDQSCTAY
jgi:prepilin-type N-terminal cleavage/methylation domain-containing protein